MAAAVDFEQATTQQAASVFGVTVEALGKWRAEIPVEAGIWWDIAGNGRAGKVVRWHLPKLVEWRSRRLAETLAAREMKPLSPLEQEQLRKLQLANGHARDRIMEDLDRQWAKVGADLRGKLESIGRRHGAAVSADLAKALADLTKGVHGVLGAREG